MRIDVALAKRLESTDAALLGSIVSHAKQMFPDRGVALEHIAGATVAYCGPQSSFNRAAGAGLHASISDADIEQIVAFFHSRSEAARIDVAPVADPQLGRKLARRGFVADDYENALLADLTEISGARDRRVEVCADPREWSQDSGDRFMRSAMATHPGILALALREYGRIVTTGCLGIEAEEFAAFFTTSTVQYARGRGYQSALIGDRLARARELGKSIAHATAEVGSTSERNFRRFGFTPVFTRALWMLPPPTME